MTLGYNVDSKVSILWTLRKTSTVSNALLSHVSWDQIRNDDVSLKETSPHRLTDKTYGTTGTAGEAE